MSETDSIVLIWFFFFKKVVEILTYICSMNDGYIVWRVMTICPLDPRARVGAMHTFGSDTRSYNKVFIFVSLSAA